MSKQKIRYIIEPIIHFPLIMPSSILGFYLLLLLGKNGPFSMLNLAFSFKGILIGSVIYSFPFAIQPLFISFEALPKNMLEFAKSDGIKYWQRFFFLALPLSANGLSRAVLIAFSHTIGAFGVILILGGSIPGQTKVTSIALWEKIEAGDYQSAHIYAAILIAFSSILLILLRFLERKYLHYPHNES